MRFDVTDRVEELRLPISRVPVTVSLWTPLPPRRRPRGWPTWPSCRIYREAQRRTGVTVAFVHPGPGSEAAALAALVASRQRAGHGRRRLGPRARRPFGRHRPGAHRPAQRRDRDLDARPTATSLARWPAQARALRTDEGHYYAFPVLAWSAADPDLALAIGATAGLQARGDLLDKLKIARLETIEDWDAALRLLKKEGGIETPLLLTMPGLALTHVFASARGASFGFFHTGGRVHYGPLEPGFRDFLALLAAWVKDGLVNADFGALDAAAHDKRVVESQAAVWIHDADGLLRLSAALKAREPAATVVALAPPQALLAFNDGSAGGGGGRPLALTSKSTKMKVSALWVDTWYSDQGRLLQHYGIPGETYRLLPDGRPELTAAGRARRFNPLPPLVGHFDAEAWRSRSPAAAEAARAWSRAATAEHALPPLSPMGREAAVEAEVLPRAAALVAEMTVKLGTGAEPMERYESYAKRLRGARHRRAPRSEAGAARPLQPALRHS